MPTLDTAIVVFPRNKSISCFQEKRLRDKIRFHLQKYIKTRLKLLSKIVWRTIKGQCPRN